MHPAEIALRRASKDGGTTEKAVAILDSWDASKRAQFRAAYSADDWRTMLLLCPSLIGLPVTFQHLVWVHLMDATTPRALTVRKAMERRANDRRKNLCGEYTTERRKGDRRLHQRRLTSHNSQHS